jgi:hypothetical protein
LKSDSTSISPWVGILFGSPITNQLLTTQKTLFQMILSLDRSLSSLESTWLNENCNLLREKDWWNQDKIEWISPLFSVCKSPSGYLCHTKTKYHPITVQKVAI